jgi:hypothetical protein
MDASMMMNDVIIMCVHTFYYCTCTCVYKRVSDDIVFLTSALAHPWAFNFIPVWMIFNKFWTESEISRRCSRRHQCHHKPPSVSPAQHNYSVTGKQIERRFGKIGLYAILYELLVCMCESGTEWRLIFRNIIAALQPMTQTNTTTCTAYNYIRMHTDVHALWSNRWYGGSCVGNMDTFFLDGPTTYGTRASTIVVERVF